MEIEQTHTISIPNTDAETIPKSHRSMEEFFFSEVLRRKRWIFRMLSKGVEGLGISVFVMAMLEVYPCTSY